METSQYARQCNDAQNTEIGMQPQPIEVPKANIDPTTNTMNRQESSGVDKGS